MQMRRVPFFAISRKGKNVERVGARPILDEERKPDQMSNRGGGGGAMRVWEGKKRKKDARRTKRKGEVDKTDNVHERDKARRVYAR